MVVLQLQSQNRSLVDKNASLTLLLSKLQTSQCSDTHLYASTGQTLTALGYIVSLSTGEAIHGNHGSNRQV